MAYDDDDDDDENNGNDASDDEDREEDAGNDIQRLEEIQAKTSTYRCSFFIKVAITALR